MFGLFLDWGKSLIKFQDLTPIFFYIFFYISRFSSCPKHKKQTLVVYKLNFFAAFLKKNPSLGREINVWDLSEISRQFVYS